ncbi:ABC transporter substrate-binding protein [Roseovarius sp. 2305UL8-3]|uniref:ABC transporter substrate-binding protein n=1 Tax=Roseovarius conchicola TaxID=3121636 RepID=UPI003526FDFB
MKDFKDLRMHDQNEVYHMIRKGATRRDLLKWFGAAGMSAAVAGPLTLSATRAYADTPKKGGHLRVSSYAQSSTDAMDPAKFTYTNDYVRAYTNYDTLVDLDEVVNPQPRLATEWEVSDDGTLWSLKLREGVTFHDGKTFSSADVVWSLMRHKDEELGSTGKALMDGVESVTADGPNRVNIQLSGPNADFIRVLGLYNFAIAAEGTTDFSNGNGTGPMVVKEFTPGVNTLYERNENYFGNVYVDSCDFFAITDGVARVNALLSGEIDLGMQIPANGLQSVESSAETQVFNIPAPAWTTLNMKVDSGPFANKDFRNAIKYMFDRDRLIKTSFKNYAVKANDHPFHPSSPYYNADLPQRDLDLDKAKSLIKSSGMEGSTIDLHISDAVGASSDMALMLQQGAARSGINVNIKREPADGYWSNIWLKRDFYASNWNARPVYDVILSIAFGSGAKWNETNFANERVDALIVEARGETDEAKRKELYGEVQAILYEDDGHMTPLFYDFIDGIRNNVKGLKKTPLGFASGFNFANKVWLDT